MSCVMCAVCCVLCVLCCVLLLLMLLGFQNMPLTLPNTNHPAKTAWCPYFYPYPYPY